MNKLSKSLKILMLWAIIIAPFSVYPSKPEGRSWANISHVMADSILISNIEIDQTLPVASDGGTVKISWDTNIPTYSSLVYGVDPNKLDVKITGAGQPQTNHLVQLFTLKSNTSYYFKVESFVNSQKAESFIRSFKTSDFKLKTLPVISDVTVLSVTGNTATISWKTDKDTYGDLAYGPNDTLPWSSGDGRLAKIHQVTINGLQPSTKYYFQVIARDADGNISRWYVDNFRTDVTQTNDTAPLIITDLRPTSLADQGVDINSVHLTFKTNRITEATIWYWKANQGNQSLNTNGYKYFSHDFNITGLQPDTTYFATIEARDVFGQTVKMENITFATKTVTKTEDVAIKPATGNRQTFAIASRLIKTADDPTVYAVIDPQSGSNVFTNGNGWLVRYYDYSVTHPDMYLTVTDPKLMQPFGKPADHDWYNDKYLVKTAIENNLNFGNDWYPLDEYNKEGSAHNFYFGAIFTSQVTAPTSGEYLANLASDDDSWLVVNDQVAINNSGMHGLQGPQAAIKLNKGVNKVEVYYAERGAVKAGLQFQFNDPNLIIQPYLERYQGTAQKHAIMSPEAFNNYHYDWGKIETVSQKQIDSYPLAQLIKTPDKATVYYVNPENRQAIPIPNEAIFNAYGFDWNSIITVNQSDVSAYYDSQLVKEPGSSTVYLLKDGQRQPIESEQVLNKLGYDFSQVVTINSQHLSYFAKGTTIRSNDVRLVTQR